LKADLSDVFKKIIIKRFVIDFDKPWPKRKEGRFWLDDVIRDGKSNLKRTDDNGENVEKNDSI